MNWYKRAAIFLIATVFSGLLIGCGKTVEQVGGADETSMFVEVESAQDAEEAWNHRLITPPEDKP
jgi:hypothetical protein